MSKEATSMVDQEKPVETSDEKGPTPGAVVEEEKKVPPPVEVEEKKEIFLIEYSEATLHSLEGLSLKPARFSIQSE